MMSMSFINSNAYGMWPRSQGLTEFICWHLGNEIWIQYNYRFLCFTFLHGSVSVAWDHLLTPVSKLNIKNLEATFNAVAIVFILITIFFQLQRWPPGSKVSELLHAFSLHKFIF